MMISKSPIALRTPTLRSMALYKPMMSASYYVVLLVHSNSKRLEIMCFLCRGSTETQLAIKPSYVFESSKNKIQTSYVQELHPTLVLLLLLYTIKRLFVPVGLRRCSNYLSGGTREG